MNTWDSYITELKGCYEAPHHQIGAREWENQSTMPNGPIMGNGDMHVVLLGDRTVQEFCISKSDMWTDEDDKKNVRAVTTGGITIRPKETVRKSEAAFCQEQLFWDGKVHAVSEAGFETDAFVSAVENVMFLLIYNRKKEPLPLSIDVWTKEDDPCFPAASGYTNGAAWAFRETSSALRGNGEPARWVSRSAIAARFLDLAGSDSQISKGKWTLEAVLPPRESRCLCVALKGGKNESRSIEQAVECVSKLDDSFCKKMEEEHLKWWHQFWQKSYVRICDTKLQNFYIGALYLMACVNRAETVPAGQYPFCISDDPAWAGDYHMDQEYLGQNEGFFSANRFELSEGVLTPLLDFMETGKSYAKHKMEVVHPSFDQPRKGVLYPVGLGPWGVDSSVHDNNGEPWVGNMVSDASYTGMLFIWQYEYYRDKEWLRSTGYPFLRELARFWTSHVRLIDEQDEKGNYCTYGATYEEAFGKNPSADLGLMHTVLDHVISYSKILGTDEEERREWQDISDHIPPYPTISKEGKEVFAEFSGAKEFRGGCELTMVFPAEAVSLLKTPKWIPIVHNTLDFELKMRTKPVHSAISAARTGYPVNKIVTALREEILEAPIGAWSGLRENYTNGSLHFNGEFIEFINSSLLQSQDGVIRLFPNWYKNEPVEFFSLRAKGAFLVSARQDENGKPFDVRIHSEKGEVCVLEAPPSVRILKGGQRIQSENSILPNGWQVCTFETDAGCDYQVEF